MIPPVWSATLPLLFAERRRIPDLLNCAPKRRMPFMNDPHDLKRFVDAQEPVYEQVLVELRNGRKEGHWMWFIFPQHRGLGHSHMATTFGIASQQEGEAYLEHAVLGPRLRECTHLVNLIEGRSIHQIFGHPDDLKFRSSMTLFASIALDNQVFKAALQKYFAGQLDPLTLERL